MMYTLRAINTDGTHAGILPDWAKFQANIEFSDVGACGFEYAVAGINANLVVQQREIAVFDDDLEVPDTRFIIESSNGNLVSREGVIYRLWAGRNLWKLFGDSCTYPPAWPATTIVNTVFITATPGEIMGDLIAAAQGRSELVGITDNFSDTLDSNGNAWAWSVSVEFEVGVPLLNVMQYLIDQGFAEARMVGRQLQLYNPGTLGTDKTTGSNPVTLWASDRVEEVPEAVDSRDLRTVALVIGDDGVVEEVEDATAIATYGRRILPLKQGGVTDAGTLIALGELNLGRQKQPRVERTTKMAVLPGGVRPMTTFIPGDWVYSNAGSTIEKMRVRQIVIDVPDSQAEASATMRLNDRFEELEVDLSRKIDGITGGSGVVGGGTGMPTDPDAVDSLPPAVPTGLGLSSITYVQNGVTFAILYATWLPVTTNADATPITDLGGYWFAWRYTNETQDDDWHVHTHDTSTSITISGLRPGRNVDAVVGAYDENGNFSGYSSIVATTLATDTTPPPTPSTPTVTPYLGQLKIFWNGLGSAAEAMPADFGHVEVHVSTVTGFTPDATTFVGVMIEKGNFIATGLSYGVARFVKLKAVDRNGNASAASAQGTATPQAVSGADLANKTIFLNHLAFSDVGNFIEDGSFESSEVRAARVLGGSWAYASDQADNGSWSIKHAGMGAIDIIDLLSADVPVRTGDAFMVSFSVRLDSTAYAALGAGESPIDVDLAVRQDGGGFVAINFDVPAKEDLDADTWSARWSVKLTSGSDWRSIEQLRISPTVQLDAGNMWVDTVELRLLMGSVHIANLAVNDALIGNVRAGKIIAGLMESEMQVSGRITTALSGARVEMSATGFRAFGAGTSQGTPVIDSFTRPFATEGEGLGIPESPQSSYATGPQLGAVGDAAADYSVDGDKALLKMDTINQGRGARIGTAKVDWQAVIDFRLDVTVTGAPIEPAIVLRRVDADNGYLIEAQLNVGGAIDIRARKDVAGTFSTIGAEAVNVATYVIDQWYKIRAEITGTSLKGKVWRRDQAEPDWQVDVTDSAIAAAGNVGFRVNQATGSTNTDPVMGFDNFAAVGYSTMAEETVHIATDGNAWFKGQILTGSVGQKRIRIDANATFNSNAGITFERGTGSVAFQPTIWAHYAAFDGAGEGGLHLISAEVTANSSGRGRLSLFQGGAWFLGSDFGTAGDGDIEANGNIDIRADDVFHYHATAFDVGVSNDQSHWIDFNSLGASSGATLSYGPTMITTPIPFPMFGDSAAVRWCVSAITTTNYTMVWENASPAIRSLILRS